MKNSEFKLGDIVTYHNGFLMRGLVINVYYEADQPRYVLLEEPEGKPISQHKRVDTHPQYIMQSRYFKQKEPVVFNYDKKENKLTQHR